MPSASEAFGAQPGWWVIEPRQHGAFARLRELWSYRYLWWYFASGNVTALYRRSALGWFWLLMRVVAPIGLNAIVFGDMLDQAQKVGDDGPPYFLFFLCGTVTWTLFERSLFFITRSVERNRRLVTRVYFPRLILPVAAVAPGLVYLALMLIVLAVTVVVFHQRDGVWYVSLTPRLLASLGAIAASLLFAIAVGLWTSVLQARYRDIRYALRYITPFWFLLTPVIYPLSTISGKYRWLVALNPMAPIVEAFKWGTLGEGVFPTVPAVMALALVVVTMVTGMWFFNREEAASVDKL
jgi:homopolymeric O-antigen transport system permease protein